MDKFDELFSSSNNRDVNLRVPYNRDLNYLSNNMFSLFLHVDFTKSRIAVPLICRRFAEGEFYHDRSITEANMMLFEGGAPFDGRMASSIFKKFVDIDFSNRIAKVTTPKGEVYYGGRGIILDKDFKPILLCDIEGNIIEGDIIYDSAKIYVNPSVFIVDGTMEKGIVKTIIPAYVKNGVRVYTSWPNTKANFHRINYKIIPEVVVKDFTDDFFVKPTKPTPSSFTKDSANEFLLDNIDDIKFKALQMV